MIKRMTALVLAMIVLCGTIAGSYKEVQAAEIIAGYGLGEILMSFFMSVGFRSYQNRVNQAL